jgi:hypothetical protein
METLELLPFQQPRYINDMFVLQNMLNLLYVIPFGAAVFTMMFIGDDVSYRAINNKISTGISRTQIFLSDFIISIVLIELTVLIEFIVFFVYSKVAPVKENVHLSNFMINSLLGIMVICAAFTAVYVLLQFFCNNKLLGLILACLIIPAMALSVELIKDKLDEPYRYSYWDEAAGEARWALNENYVSGFPRTALEFLYQTNPYSYEYFSTEEVSLKTETEAAAVVVILSTGLGLLSINKKEYQ